MISFLNGMVFKEFGIILPSSIKASKSQKEDRIYKSFNELVCYPNNSVYLERIDDMCVIALSVGGSIHQFYLDKPVEINPGVWFCVLILGENGCFRRVIEKDSICKSKELPSAFVSPLFVSVLTVNNIYTLFHQEHKKGFVFPGEKHRPYELVYVDTGILNSVTDGQILVLKQGEMVMYMPNQWHVQYAEPDCSVSFITISFDMACEYTELLCNRKLSGGRHAKRLLARMLDEKQENRFLRDDMLQNNLKELLIVLLRQECSAERPVPIDTASTDARESSIIAAALQYINDNLDKRLSVNMVAKGVYLSTSYISALFRKNLRMSPSKYIHRVKISESKRLIQSGNYTLTEISQKLGFATLQHFSRLFKAETGVTPSEYAKALK